MKKIVFMEKYPVYSIKLKKNEVNVKNVDEIISYFENKIDTHPIAKKIAVFDHYTHTKNLKGEISDKILDMKNIVFCFGTTIAETTISAVRPRSIGISELEDTFSIDFLEVPREELNNLLQQWTKELLKK